MKTMVWILGVAGCGFSSPWRDAEPTEARLEGWMLAGIDDPQPGAGWFRTGEVEAHDFGQAAIRAVRGAKDDVLVLQIGRVAPEGVTVLELDVALSAWAAGEVPVDGVSSIGQLRGPGGEDRFVVDGVLDVRAAGASPGELVELSFTDLVLAEAP